MQNIRVEVTDKDGWRKEYVLQKTINHVGVDTRNDVVLETSHGAGVSARHLQLIVNDAGCRLVNIGNGDISIASGVYDTSPGATPTQVHPLAPLSSTNVQNGTWIKVGDFTLRVRMNEPVAVPQSGTPQAPAAATTPAPAPAFTPVPAPQQVATQQTAAAALATAAATLATATASPGGFGTFTPTSPATPVAPAPAAGGGDSIGLRLQLEQTTLGLDAPLEGSVIVRNAGSRPGAQFRLEIQGLPPECYEIGPGPILFPNAEKEVSFKLIHSKKASPPAGDLQLLIRATSPDAYPGQVAIVTQTIQVMPFYQHALTMKATD